MDSLRPPGDRSPVSEGHRAGLSNPDASAHPLSIDTSLNNSASKPRSSSSHATVGWQPDQDRLDDLGDPRFERMDRPCLASSAYRLVLSQHGQDQAPLCLLRWSERLEIQFLIDGYRPCITWMRIGCNHRCPYIKERLHS